MNLVEYVTLQLCGWACYLAVGRGIQEILGRKVK